MIFPDALFPSVGVVYDIYGSSFLIIIIVIPSFAEAQAVHADAVLGFHKPERAPRSSLPRGRAHAKPDPPPSLRPSPHPAASAKRLRAPRRSVPAGLTRFARVENRGTPFCIRSLCVDRALWGCTALPSVFCDLCPPMS